MAGKYLDYDGLRYLWGKLKAYVSGLFNGDITIGGGLSIKNGQSDVQIQSLGSGTYAYLELNGGVKKLRLVSNSNGNIGLYDPVAGKWIIRNDTNGDTYLAGHNSPIGTILTSRLASEMSLAHNTPKALCSITLPAGTWMLIGYVRFPANNNGVRRLNFAETADTNYIHQQAQPAQGAVTQMQVTLVTTSTSEATWYLNAQQTSGSALTMPAGTADGYTNGIRAVQIA